MTGFDRQTLEFYSRQAPIYTASGKGGINRALPAFVTLLPPGAHILELGCGGGLDAEYLIQRGFTVDATDGVAEMAAKAERRLGQPVRVMRFDELVSSEEYDAVLASYSLLHVPLTELPDILQRVWFALKPCGHHLAIYKAGGTEGRDTLGRYFNYVSHEQAETAYKAAGPWTKLEIEDFTAIGYDGKEGPRLTIVAQK
ncbi:MAG: class I SAM-dependent methyltransferase [Pseudomonadota bacterium]